MSTHKVLFVTSEASPLIKTGGLADVCGALPAALRESGLDVRLLLPGYRDLDTNTGQLERVATLDLKTPAVRVEILAGETENKVPFWLIEYPPAFDRPGNPYLDRWGIPWSDNAARFSLLARVAVEIAQDRAALNWRPDLVHCHDWQAGLVPALLSVEPRHPATVFTIHNLSYQGRFDRATFDALHLPSTWWSADALEFYGDMSFIKGGLVFADTLTTVSPSYAKEIQTPAYGCGLEGLLSHRASDLHGILNGIDDQVWDPAHDKLIAKPYDCNRLAAKAVNKRALLREVGLPEQKDTPLAGMIGRLVPQKGIDLAMEAMTMLSDVPMQWVILGSGFAEYEQALRELAAREPNRIAVHLGYAESLAHRIEAGADLFVMPSRYEPCGLNQMYSLRYGTVPIVHRVGGMADTVVDATPQNLSAETATGFVFNEPSALALARAIRRAASLYSDQKRWTTLMRTAMVQDFSWQASAARYQHLYEQVCGAMAKVPAA